jgi:hypothetical protein
MKSVFLAVPNRGSIAEGTAVALARMGATPVQVCFRSTSVLTLTFNSLWAEALNSRGTFDYFVMLHDDVEPANAGWVDHLVSLFESDEIRGKGVLSVMLPIKDDRGLTSTAVVDPTTRTMTRVTTTEANSPSHGAVLGTVLPNTGLWICDFTKPWVEKICFTNRDRVFKCPESGQWVAQAYSEDWDFGMQCYALGVPVAVTSKVHCFHKGEFKYPNFVGFGKLKVDDQANVWNPPERVYRKG